MIQKLNIGTWIYLILLPDVLITSRLHVYFIIK